MQAVAPLCILHLESVEIFSDTLCVHQRLQVNKADLMAWSQHATRAFRENRRLSKAQV